MITKRNLKYFKTLVDGHNIEELLDAGYLNEKAIRDKLIREEYYKMLQELKSGKAIEKLANDYGVSFSSIEKIVRVQS